jgi:cell division protein FtsI/penicillin-binding protein 2
MFNGRMSKRRRMPICLIDEVELLHAIERLRIKGAYRVSPHVAMYPFGSAGAHITGFVNHDGDASCGVEKYIDFDLRGQAGFIVSEMDGLNRELVEYRTQNIPATNGLDVVLRMDAKIQQMVADEPKNIADTFHFSWRGSWQWP